MSSQWETIQFSLKPKWHPAPLGTIYTTTPPSLLFPISFSCWLSRQSSSALLKLVKLFSFSCTYSIWHLLTSFLGDGVKRGHTYQNYISFSDRISNFLMYTFKKCGELYNALTLKHCLSPSCSDVETVGLSGAGILSKADLCWAATDAKPRFIFFPKLPQSFQFTDGRMMSSCPFQRAVHFNPNFQFCCFEEFWPWGSFYHLLCTCC